MINIIHKITFALLLLLVFSCEDSNINREFSDTPTSFTKKVLLEEFTGSWCGYCPSGAEILQNLMNSYSVIGVALHSSCLLYTSPSPRDAHESRMPSSA